tara:strand:- start:433 stop:753 length:321 start_codon:yes stop_codon:yes gene_type:complete
MAELSTKIEKYVGRKVNFLTEVLLQDNGEGAFIAEWNIKDISKPTNAQLKAKETEANVEEANREQIRKRMVEYGSPVEQIQNIIENGLEAEQQRVASIKTKYPKSE